MKKISILLLTLFLAFSCSDNLEDLNKDTKNATVAAGETFFTGAQKNMVDYMASINVNRNVWRQFAQQVTATTYPEEANYNITDRKIPDNLWAAMYRDVLKDLDESAKVLTATPTVGTAGATKLKNQLAIIEVMNVYAYATLVETFGNIPYTDALDFNNVLPKYDDGKTVYVDLIARLSAAITKMDAAGASFGSADIVYGGNVGKWKKFANSFKLRMGLMIYDADATLGASTVSSAITSGVFTSNGDNALFQYLNSTPNTNPMWVDLVQSGRLDFVAAAPMVNAMNGLNDPRVNVFYKDPVGGVIKGAPYGANNSYALFSHIGSMFYESTLPHVLLDYANVKFMLAEAAERSLGGMTPTAAEAHYNAAITASFDYNQQTYNSLKSPSITLNAAAYLAQPSVAYTTAAGTWKQKIGTQKWIALYNQGFNAWTEFRRLDYPALVAPGTGVVNVVPRRFTYPIGEHTLNGTNYTSAASAVGGDLLTTKLFWDKF
ncbi:MAG: SusD/RagB family nutrient-binding outer membrane lipoprotein [Flavobacteriaceae bacterium]|nr:SusD/RagB family nutrient-binding outer membrane lipoprotein [Flavobacteriaceae bacterium]